MKPRAIIFDLFSTLVDNFTSDSYVQVLLRMANALDVPADDFKRIWQATVIERMMGVYGGTTHDNIAQVCMTLGVVPPIARIAEAGGIRIEFSRQSLNATSDVLNTLAKLRADGYPIGLVTDCTAEVPELWSTTELAPLIDHPVFSCNEGMTKPDPRIYLLACQGLQVEPRQCLYIGDGSSRELTGAAGVGMRAILIKGTHVDFAGIDRTDALSWSGEAVSNLRDILPIVT